MGGMEEGPQVSKRPQQVIDEAEGKLNEGEHATLPEFPTQKTAAIFGETTV